MVPVNPCFLRIGGEAAMLRAVGLMSLALLVVFVCPVVS